MVIELRSIPDCPHLPPARDLLRACLAELGLPLTATERVGPYPSPSVLVDGIDVMGAPADGASCRLDVPTAEAIRAALRRALGAEAATRCCEGGPIRADRPELAAVLSPVLRAVYQSVLRHFARSGTAPAVGDLAAPDGADAVDALARLADMDLLAVDGGRLVAAYPFSPTPTAHVVYIGGGVRVYAMCAVDALGISPMLGHDTVIESVDPQTRQMVRVIMTGSDAYFTPADTVVVYAASGASGRSVDTCCTTINFFTSPVSAQDWIATHGHLTATLLDQRSALALGRDIFGTLLS